MAASGRPVVVPSVDEVVSLNRWLVEEFGGTFAPPDNLRNKDSLEWVLHSMQHPISFGHNRYPTIAHKAALLVWEIITAHVFVDGNKRTGMAAANTFLLTNGYGSIQASEDELVKTALDIATHRESGMAYERLVTWFEERIVELPGTDAAADA